MERKIQIRLLIGGLTALVVIVIIIVIATRNSNGPSPKLYISQGIIQGRTYYTRDGKLIYGYLGIPYAETPKRFQAPVEAATMWEGIRDGTKYRAPCPQMNDKKQFIGEEDCLFLNVFTSNLNASLPVMFYIYGGGFYEGHGGLYKPDFMMDENIVLVTINYRVGAFGFLCTDDGEVQGNMGLKDQAVALRWVKKNIASFGGDKNRVTIFGSSAGSASVSYQVLSPMSRQLFNNAIMEGGSALNPWAINWKPTALTTQLGLQLGCITTRSMRELIQCLKDTPPAQIAKQTFIKWHQDPHISYAPCIERSRSAEVFLSDYPINILRQGRFNRVNVILGIAKDEGLLLHAASILLNKTLLNQLNTQFNLLAPITLIYDEDPAVPPSRWQEISTKIKEFYFPNNTLIGDASKQSLINMYSDRWFIHGIQEEAFLLGKYVNVYPYILSYVGESSVLEMVGIKKVMGVAHGDDIQYFFDEVYSKALSSSRDKDFSRKMVKLWASFAETGIPSEIWAPRGMEWPKVTPINIKNKELSWLELNDQTKVINGSMFKNRMTFWNLLMPFDRS